jgi:hypothetical protein
MSGGSGGFLKHYALTRLEDNQMENTGMNNANLDYVVNNYGFLIKHPAQKREYNNTQFAEAIKKHYSLDDPRNKYCYDFCLNTSFKVRI